MSAARDLVHQQLRARNLVSSAFFEREAVRLSRTCALMASRFLRGGRLFAFGSGSYASDAQHVAVEFVHPVLVGKRALPAFDLSASHRVSIPALVAVNDIVMGFGPPGGDSTVHASLEQAAARGALCLSLSGAEGDYVVGSPSVDPFIHQEVIEILYHALWETVHVFFDREPIGQSAGAASFLYPFLGGTRPSAEDIIPEVARSIRSKAALDERLRDEVAAGQSEAIVSAAAAMYDRIASGGVVLCFGNGGSATDANDLASDLFDSPKGYPPIAAASLSADAAMLTGIVNDVGAEAAFVRQLIAYGRPSDIALAISTSGGSANIVAALQEARSRGLLTVALLGYDGGEVIRRQLADHVVVVHSDQIPRVQEIHASIYHVMLDLLESIRAVA